MRGFLLVGLIYEDLVYARLFLFLSLEPGIAPGRIFRNVLQQQAFAFRVKLFNFCGCELRNLFFFGYVELHRNNVMEVGQQMMDLEEMCKILESRRTTEKRLGIRGHCYYHSMILRMKANVNCTAVTNYVSCTTS